MDSFKQLIKQALDCDADLGDVRTEQLKEVLVALARIDSYEGFTKQDTFDLVKLCSKYLENVLMESSFSS